jgi:hypothetical protein
MNWVRENLTPSLGIPPYKAGLRVFRYASIFTAAILVAGKYDIHL